MTEEVRNMETALNVLQLQRIAGCGRAGRMHGGAAVRRPAMAALRSVLDRALGSCSRAGVCRSPPAKNGRGRGEMHLDQWRKDTGL